MIKASLKNFKDSLLSPVPDNGSKHLIENFYVFDLKVSPAEIWPYLADTSRMNKELGFPPRVEKDVGGVNHVSTTTLGRMEEWIEKPWTWITEKELQSHRIFQKGWMSEQRGVFTVCPTETGCRVSIYFHWTFRNIFTKLLFSPVGNVLAKNFDKFFKSKEEFIIKTRDFDKKVLKFEIHKEAKVALLDYIKNADELDLDRLHLKILSRELNHPLEELMRASKELIEEGLLSLTWDVVCPHCRGAKTENPSLDSIKEKNSCDTCDIEFSLGPEESLEIVFHPTEKLRKVNKFVYCAAEPAKKKHIKLHQVISPGKQTFPIKLKVGKYRARIKGQEEMLDIEVTNSGEKSIKWNGTKTSPVQALPEFEFEFQNASDKDLVLSLEEAWWFNDRLLPGEVLTSPLRELFNENHLATGVNLNVGHQVILFTDIVGSTPLYKMNGDAYAFKVVQSHYQEVTKIIREYNGVVVKFIGDAVMASFLDLKDAYLASTKIHETFSDGRKDTPIRLRISLHRGPVLCANLNIGLDYFGTTVNNSAKIQKWVDSFEIAMAKSDWEQLQKNFPDVTIHKALRDEKLEMDVVVFKVA